MRERFSKIWSTFFGVGYFPVAPGTAASLTVVLLFKWLLWPMSPWLQAAIILSVFISGVAATGFYAAGLKKPDPRSAVIDEVCGQLIALLAVSPDLTTLLVAFFLFRFLDVVKPWPIRKLEQLPAGWGIMADDVAAGILSRMVVQVFLAVIR